MKRKPKHKCLDCVTMEEWDKASASVMKKNKRKPKKFIGIFEKVDIREFKRMKCRTGTKLFNLKNWKKVTLIEEDLRYEKD